MAVTRAERTFPADVEAVREAVAFAAAGAAEAGIDASRLTYLELAVEEAVVNICRYAYQDEPGSYRLEVRCDGAEATVEIEDQGAPFDPLAAPEPDLDAPLEERRIGGLGIHLIRKLTSEAHYRRNGQRNVLTLVLRASDPPA